MSINEKDVAYVADLANLELTAEERVRFIRDLNSILEYFERLTGLDTTDVPPMSHVSDRYSSQSRAGQGFTGANREDVIQPCLLQDAALQNAPFSDGVFFKVPRVIEK